jgi:hypothetical protein
MALFFLFLLVKPRVAQTIEEYKAQGMKEGHQQTKGIMAHRLT